MTPQLINVREEMAGLVPSRRYATHAIDRYPAKMIPQLARFGIELCTEAGDKVFDPFCGCGTVAVESRLSGRASTGVDINPYAVVLARAKTHVYDDSILDDIIETVLDAARRSRRVPLAPSWLDYWFHPLTLRQLLRIRAAIDSDLDERGTEYNDALRAILAVTVRLASKADPRSPKPFISKRAKENRCTDPIDAFKVFERRGKQFRRASVDFRSRLESQVTQPFEVRLLNASQLPPPETTDSLFDAVVSSPPYLSAQDYYRSSKLELGVLGITQNSDARTLGPLMIGSGRGATLPLSEPDLIGLPSVVRDLYSKDRRAASVVSSYIRDMTQVVSSCASWTKSGGSICLIVGNSTIRDLVMPTHEWFIECARVSGLSLKEHYLDAVQDRRLAPKRKSHTSVIEHEHIMIFSK